MTGLLDRHPRVTLLVLLALVALLWAANFATDRFVNRDALDYAQIGRQIATGAGHTTLQTFPRHLPYMAERDLLQGEAWPSLLRYPLIPTLNALLQKLGAGVVEASVLQTGLCFLLSVPLLFALARRFAGSGWALLATLFYVGDPRVWRNGYNGMTEACATLLLLAALYLATSRGTAEGQRSSWLALGAVCGLAYLCRTQLAFLLVLAALCIPWLVASGRRLRSAGCLALGAAAATGPWLVRNFLVTGNPLFSFVTSRNLMAQTTAANRSDRLLHAPVDLGEVFSTAGPEILGKVGAHLWPNLADPGYWVELFGPWALAVPVLAMALFFPGTRSASQGQTLLRLTTLALVAANFLVVALSHYRQRFFDPLLPLLLLLLVTELAALWAAWQVHRQARRQGGSVAFSAALDRRLALVGLSLVLLVGLARLSATLGEHRASHGHTFPPSETYGAIAELAGDQVVVSDLSAQLALYAQLRSLRPPVDPQELAQIDQQYLSADFLVLSDQFLRRQTRWRAFMNRLLESGRYQQELPELAGLTVLRRSAG